MPAPAARRRRRRSDLRAAVRGLDGRPDRERALDHVFGYTVANDVTARDRQAVPQPDGSFVYRFGPGKNFDTAAPLGPWIVTADEIPDPQALAAYVGGSPTNISVGGRRLGLRTALLTGIGDDPVGDFVLRLLGENGVIEESSGFYVGRELKIPER
jgi:Fumarylacetoacetate (FAA) hydrolase family/pfkB family carbohydrate kinase